MSRAWWDWPLTWLSTYILAYKLRVFFPNFDSGTWWSNYKWVMLKDAFEYSQLSCGLRRWKTSDVVECTWWYYNVVHVSDSVTWHLLIKLGAWSVLALLKPGHLLVMRPWFSQEWCQFISCPLQLLFILDQLWEWWRSSIYVLGFYMSPYIWWSTRSCSQHIDLQTVVEDSSFLCLSARLAL